MERKRSGAGVCFPSGWWWATAASINTCLHGSHISCFTPHPSAGPHRLRTPQRAVCVCVCVCVCICMHACMVCILMLLRLTWNHVVCADLSVIITTLAVSARLREHTHTHTHTSHISAECKGRYISYQGFEGGQNQAYSPQISNICGFAGINTIHLLPQAGYLNAKCSVSFFMVHMCASACV